MLIRFFRLAGVVLFLTACLMAQDVRGTFSGTVTDIQGAAVPKARITAIEEKTNAKTQGVSESSGAYTIPFLSPGTYDLVAESAGFKEFVSDGLLRTA
jgi:hypothetical protein